MSIPKNLIERCIETHFNDKKENIKSEKIIRISEESLKYFYNLEIITICDTSISYLPENLFSSNKFLKEVNFKSNKIKELPENNLIKQIDENLFNDTKKLEYITLDENRLESLPKNIFKGLENLSELNLFGNNLSEVPPAVFSELTNLQFLYLTANKISGLDSGTFATFKKLKELAFSENQIKHLPSNMLLGLNNLESIFIIKNKLSSLPDNIFKDCKNLKEINLSYNSITKLPESLLDGLSKLVTLNLGHNNIEYIPKEFFNGLYNLEIIDFSKNSIDDISNLFRYELNLSFIYFDDNRIKNLEENVFDQLKRLKKVSFQNNSIDTLSNKIFNNQNILRSINFRGNNISNLSDDLFLKNEKLYSCDFSHNRIKNINIELFSKLKELNQVNFSSNKIQDLNKDLFKGLDQLENIDFSNNAIEKLNKELFTNKNYLKINFSSNKISKLDEDIFETCILIEILNFSKNTINFLPKSIFNKCKMLQNIDFSYNNVQVIENDFFNQLLYLEKVNFCGNSIQIVNDYLFCKNFFIKDVNFSKNRILELSPKLFSLMNAGKVKVNFTENSDFYDFESMFNRIFDLNSNTDTETNDLTEYVNFFNVFSYCTAPELTSYAYPYDVNSGAVQYNSSNENIDTFDLLLDFESLKNYYEKDQESYAKKSKNDLEKKKKELETKNLEKTTTNKQTAKGKEVNFHYRLDRKNSTEFYNNIFLFYLNKTVKYFSLKEKQEIYSLFDEFKKNKITVLDFFIMMDDFENNNLICFERFMADKIKTSTISNNEFRIKSSDSLYNFFKRNSDFVFETFFPMVSLKNLINSEKIEQNDENLLKIKRYIFDFEIFLNMDFIKSFEIILENENERLAIYLFLILKFVLKKYNNKSNVKFFVNIESFNTKLLKVFFQNVFHRRWSNLIKLILDYFDEKEDGFLLIQDQDKLFCLESIKSCEAQVSPLDTKRDIYFEINASKQLNDTVTSISEKLNIGKKRSSKEEEDQSLESKTVKVGKEIELSESNIPLDTFNFSKINDFEKYLNLDSSKNILELAYLYYDAEFLRHPSIQKL
ncbi:unnamed protein product, partial [Brachionus calyciflorus]